MKTKRDQLFSLGAACVLALGVVLAQDQAPQAQGIPPPEPAVAAPAPQAPAPAVIPTRRPSLMSQRRPVLPARGASSDAAAPGTVAPAAAGSGNSAQGTESGEPRSKTTAPSLKFDNTTVDIVLMAYAQETGKTLLPAPDVPKANITLKSQTDAPLTKEEYLEAIEAVLSMNGIVLEPFGEKFVKVLARKTVRTDGIRIQMDSPEGGYPEKSQVVSQMIQLKAITISEAQKALEGFKKPDGMIQTFERTNSLLVTDTQENVNRMLEVVKFIDQPLVATEEVNVRVIRFAKAEDIKKRLEELVAESQKQTQAKEEVKANVAGAPGFTRTTTLGSSLTRPLPPGLSRLGAPQPAVATPNEILETLVSDADRGMIRGKVQIIADERSNQLIIITRKENMDFFERIISVLDIETAPDVKVEVQRLEFADAEEVSTMLNDLIGNATSKKDDKAPAGAAKSTSNAPGEASKSTTLAEAVAARTASRAETSVLGESGKTKLGALSKDNLKILADKRTNAIVMMGSIGDLAAIKEIIKGMDIKLSQVLIETVVLEVGLKNSIETGLDWVKRIKNRGDTYYSVGGGGGTKTPQNLGEIAAAISTNIVGGVVTSGSSGLEYFTTFKDLKLDVVIAASKSDNDAKVLSSPILLTVDNKEATIEATELKYMYKGMRYMGYSSSVGGAGSYEPDIEQRDVGLTVKVTPRINPSGNVILTVEETFEDVLGSQTINGQDWPTVTTRKLSADVSVGDGETVIFGGLVKTAKSDSSSGIPILKDIPYIGKYIFGMTKKEEIRSELLVFLTPYVINDSKDMDREARRRKDYVNATDIWTKGWSDSKLADPVSAAEMKVRLERKNKIEKAWRDYRKDLEDQHEVDTKIIDERTRTEAVIDAKAAEVSVREASAEQQPVGTLKVTESVEVLGPKGGAQDGLISDNDTRSAPRLEAEEPKKAWWRLW